MALMQATSAVPTDELHALQGPDHGRHLQGGMQCGSYCAGWNEKNFCTEYMCDEDTRGYTCDSLRESAGLHFKEVASKNGQPACVAIMEKLSCVCVNQAVITQHTPDRDQVLPRHRHNQPYILLYTVPV
jgi:hypothetical protein